MNSFNQLLQMSNFDQLRIRQAVPLNQLVDDSIALVGCSCIFKGCMPTYIIIWSCTCALLSLPYVLITTKIDNNNTSAIQTKYCYIIFITNTWEHLTS